MQTLIQNVLDQAPDAILVANGLGLISYANRHAQEIFGYAPEELVGQHVNLLIPPQLRAAHDQHLAKLRNSDPSSIFGLRREVPGLHRDGRELILELHVNPLQGESEPMFIATFSDILDRKQKELHREVLAEQLSRQNQQLRQLIRTRMDANRIKSEFLAYVSQEIRTPLTTILESVEQLSQETAVVEPAAPRPHLITSIKSACEQLQVMHGELLDLCENEEEPESDEGMETYPPSTVFQK